ncbi:MAG: carboxypeptidase regulatory-like domain-containing protein [Pyrinomonadaceae bacterium]
MRSPFKAGTLFFARAFALSFLALAFVLLSSLPAFAQAITGTVKGTVHDQNGAVVAGASVTAKNQGTNVEAGPYTSTGEGNFVIPGLIPGKYTITVESAGFNRAAVTDVDVKVGVDTPLTVTMNPGSVTETVTVVSGTEEIVNRDQSQISASFEARKIEDLPSNAAGGGLDTLALLIPGIAQNSGGGTNTNGTGFSVNGNRSRSNNFQIDGSDNNDLSVAGPNLFIDNQDQIQEYQVITNNFSAQYGRNLGAVINIVTKSGTNDFHGTAFEFFRDQRNLDSLTNKERASGLDNPPRALSHVFGGTVGGPLYLPRFGEGGPSTWSGKNRAFFFFAYEGIRQPSEFLAQSGGFGINQSDLGKLTAGFPGNRVIAGLVALNPTALNLGTLRARSDLSDCNATTLRLGGAPVSQFSRCNRDFIDVGAGVAGVTPVRVEGFLLERIFRTDFTQNEWSLRGDVKATDKDNFYIRYLDQNGVFLNNLGSTNGFSGDVPFVTRNLGGSYTRQISSNIVNEFRSVRTKLFVSFGGGCDAATPGCIPDSNEIDSAQIENLNLSGIRGVTLTGNALRAMGMGGGLPQGRTTTLYQFADNLNFRKGRHSMIAGAEFKYTTSTVPFLPNYGGSYTFNSQTRVMNNAPSAVSIALGDPTVPYTEIDQFYFFQDDFKIRPNLTLNIGMRYEYTGQPINDLTVATIERENGGTPFWNPALPVDARIVPRTPVDKNNFAPRVGFAWSPRFESGFMKKLLGENDATVIRGGYAIAYDPAFYNILLNVANSSPFSLALAATAAQTPATNPLLPLAGIFGRDNRAFVQAAGVLPIGKLDPKWLGQTLVAPNFHSPYSQQWSLGIQRQINGNNVAEVRYVGNHGVGLFQNVQRNPFVGVPGDPNLEFGTAGAASGLYGFTLDGIHFPSFAAQVIPSGSTGLNCVNIASTLDNEASCLGRILQRGARTSRENTAQSRYDSLQARYNGRFLNRAMNLGLAYTWSKTIDNSSEIFTFGTENSSFAQNPFDYAKGERSVSALHRPHIFSMNFIYDVPYFKSQSGFAGHLLGGWQINGTHVYNTGRRYTAGQNLNAGFLGLGPSYLSGGEGLRPFNANPNAPQGTVGINQVDAFLFGLLETITNQNGFLSLNDLNNGTIRNVTANDVRFIYNGPGAAKLFGTPFGTSTRYNLTGPAINQTNIGIFKNTRVTETIRVQFRAELFNAFNHPQPGYGVTRNGSLPSILADNAGIAGGAFADNDEIDLARRVVQFGLRIIF